jgi:hypothetical protein
MEESIMRGRRPAGPDYVDHLPDCDDETKRRLKVIMQTLCGDLRVNEACAILGISPQRFHQMREEAMLGAAAVLKPRPKGRPPRPPSPQQQQLEQLQQELGDAQIELRAAQARAEIATLLPRVLQAPPRSSAQKKTRRRR